jgi:hypothetical protein
MKKLLCLLMVLAVCSLAYAGSDSDTQTVTITSPSSLSIAVPAAVAYTLTDPLNAGDETAAAGQALRLDGNNFAMEEGEAYLTATANAVSEYLHLVLQGEEVTTTIPGASPNFAGSETPLDDALPHNYVIEEGDDPVRGAGRLDTTHDLIVRKTQAVPAGAYVTIITWTGYDSY